MNHQTHETGNWLWDGIKLVALAICGLTMNEVALFLTIIGAGLYIIERILNIRKILKSIKNES